MYFLFSKSISFIPNLDKTQCAFMFIKKKKKSESVRRKINRNLYYKVILFIKKSL